MNKIARIRVESEVHDDLVSFVEYSECCETGYAIGNIGDYKYLGHGVKYDPYSDGYGGNKKLNFYRLKDFKSLCEPGDYICECHTTFKSKEGEFCNSCQKLFCKECADIDNLEGCKYCNSSKHIARVSVIPLSIYGYHSLKHPI